MRQEFTGYGKNAPVQGAAAAGAKGYLQKASGGTIFIDEVAELPDDFQTFLLRILDGNEIRPAPGEADPFTPDVRLIFATNDEEKIANESKFRHDLFDRIKRFQIEIPALDNRKEDIFEFVNTRRDGHRVEPNFYLALLRHSWTGNVRELNDVIDAAVVKTEKPKDPLTVDLLDIDISDDVRTYLPKCQQCI